MTILKQKELLLAKLRAYIGSDASVQDLFPESREASRPFVNDWLAGDGQSLDENSLVGAYKQLSNAGINSDNNAPLSHTKESKGTQI